MHLLRSLAFLAIVLVALVSAQSSTPSSISITGHYQLTGQPQFYASPASGFARDMPALVFEHLPDTDSKKRDSAQAPWDEPSGVAPDAGMGLYPQSGVCYYNGACYFPGGTTCYNFQGNVQGLSCYDSHGQYCMFGYNCFFPITTPVSYPEPVPVTYPEPTPNYPAPETPPYNNPTPYNIPPTVPVTYPPTEVPTTPPYNYWPIPTAPTAPPTAPVSYPSTPVYPVPVTPPTVPVSYPPTPVYPVAPTTPPYNYWPTSTAPTTPPTAPVSYPSTPVYPVPVNPPTVEPYSSTPTFPVAPPYNYWPIPSTPVAPPVSPPYNTAPSYPSAPVATPYGPTPYANAPIAEPTSYTPVTPPIIPPIAPPNNATGQFSLTMRQPLGVNPMPLASIMILGLEKPTELLFYASSSQVAVSAAAPLFCSSFVGYNRCQTATLQCYGRGAFIHLDFLIC